MIDIFFTFFPSMTLNLLRETGPVTLGEQVAGEKVLNQTSTYNNKSQFSFSGKEEQFLGQVVEDQPETSRNATDISEEECQQGGEDHINMSQSCLQK